MTKSAILEAIAEGIRPEDPQTLNEVLAESPASELEEI